MARVGVTALPRLGLRRGGGGRRRRRSKAALWDSCELKLDEASQLDPAGDSAPEVTAARRAIEKGRADEARKLKPPLK